MTSKQDEGFWNSTAGVVVAVLLGALGLPLLISGCACGGLFGLWYSNASHIQRLGQRQDELQVEIYEQEEILREEYRQREWNDW